MKVAMNDISSGIADCTQFGPLAGLSIQHTWPGVTPIAPSNEDRARAFRQVQPVALANHFHWPFQHGPFEHPVTEESSATAALAMDEKHEAPMQEQAAGNRRLSLVRVA